MLLAPQLEQRCRQPAPMAEKLVDKGVASRTEGDQPAMPMAAGPAMVDHTLVGSTAALAAVAVAEQDFIAVAGEVAEGAPVPAITGSAQPRDLRRTATGLAEKRSLAKGEKSIVYRMLLAIRSVIISYFSCGDTTLPPDTRELEEVRRYTLGDREDGENSSYARGWSIKSGRIRFGGGIQGSDHTLTRSRLKELPNSPESNALHVTRRLFESSVLAAYRRAATTK
jgi:hypothetical protein